MYIPCTRALELGISQPKVCFIKIRSKHSCNTLQSLLRIFMKQALICYLVLLVSYSSFLYLSISKVYTYVLELICILKKYSHFILLSTLVKTNKREKCWLAEHFCVSTHAIVFSYASYFYESYCMRFYNDVKLSTEVGKSSLISFYSF